MSVGSCPADPVVKVSVFVDRVALGGAMDSALMNQIRKESVSRPIWRLTCSLLSARHAAPRSGVSAFSWPSPLEAL